MIDIDASDNNPTGNDLRRHFRISGITAWVITVGTFLGVIAALVAQRFQSGTFVNILLLTVGSGLISTVFISLLLDLVWGREKMRIAGKEIQPVVANMKQVISRLEDVEGRLDAFKKIGFNRCHASREDALGRFCDLAKAYMEDAGTPKDSELTDRNSPTTIDIVSSSARGLMGYLDRKVLDVQKEWRHLILESPRTFRLLLTHPAYAHLRQPAEERSSGDIELEILKATVYLHLVAGMGDNNLRFYRGSPTVFSIRVGKNILLNPYPYGQMAMETLCLEFESDSERSYVSKFIGRHFDHTWSFRDQDSKRVDGRPLVEGIRSFDDILNAFSECTFLDRPKLLRLSLPQLIELDTFVSSTLPNLMKRDRRNFSIPSPKSARPFSDFARSNGMKCFPDTDIEEPPSLDDQMEATPMETTSSVGVTELVDDDTG